MAEPHLLERGVAARCEDERIARLVALFETLVAADLDRLHEFYAVDARFKDPFNDVQGLAAVRAVYAHMFRALDEPRFVVRDIVAQRDQCFLTWDFVFRFKRFGRELQTVRGATQLRLDGDGRIAEHRDWWDAAEELYEKLPGIGAFMRWMKRRANA